MIASAAVRRALRRVIWPLHRSSAVAGGAVQPRLMLMSDSCPWSDRGRLQQQLASSVAARWDGEVLGPLQTAQFIRRELSSSGTAPPEEGTDAAAPKPPDAPAESPPDEQKQTESYGVSNFQKMLQYQKGAKGPTGEVRGPMEMAGVHRMITVHSAKGWLLDRGTRSNENLIREHALSLMLELVAMQGGIGPKTPRVASSVGAIAPHVPLSNTPPTSNLSDMYHSLNQIVEYELEKGIIDLDALETTYRDDVATRNALHDLGASESLYSTQQIADDGTIPLWTPPADQTSFDEHPCPFIHEARLHLSYRARPDGWFLRLPHRSVAHAVLHHVRRAEEHREQQQPRLRRENAILKGERREWRTGLWKGVWNEYERKFVGEARRTQLEEESQEEKGLMWGDDLGEEEAEVEGLAEAEDTNQVNTTRHVEEESESTDEGRLDDASEHLRQYLEVHPYPSQSMTSSAQQSPYQFLMCGSKTLSVQEFSPCSSGHPSSENGPLPWEQHTFRLSPMLNLSDSVVRVETTDLKVNAGDIRYLFRGYDLESVYPDSEGKALLPARLSGLPLSLGWNINSHGNVDMLVRGASARMAVRDQDGSHYRDFGVSMVQYPRQW
ncbi:hypothetical protein ACHAXT_009914 [Thalassiosira profunda]